MRPALAVILVAAACGDDGAQPDAGLPPTANAAREIVDTQLAFDVTALSGTATIVFAASDTPGATLEVGDLVIDSVSVPHALTDNTMSVAATDKLMDLALPASGTELSVEVTFHYTHHTAFNGASVKGYTLVWPYHCGNLFPCHSDPSDGTTFSSVAVTGVPAGTTAVVPTMISEAPSYQIAFSVDMYTEVPLGTTTAGTQIVVWHRPANATKAMTGTTNLVAAFNWLEQTIGPYRFGNKAGTVDANWGAGGFGGMEHHPFWHVGSAALADEETNVHEAAHGWFGDGIRIQCWEDFVLSEGTVTYLAARALDVVAPSVGASVWTSYASELADVAGAAPVWPQSCGAIDIIEDDLFSRAPYMRGAFFYRGIAQKLGDPALLDQAIAAFYAEHAGKAATMQQMLDKITAVTGYDPTACAQTWLRSTTKPTPGPCP